MPGQAVLCHEGAKVPRRVARKGGFREMRILGEEAFRLGFEIGEVATAATRNANFLSWFLGMIEHQDRSPALSDTSTAEQSGCTAAENQGINVFQNSFPIRQSWQKSLYSALLAASRSRVKDESIERKGLHHDRLDIRGSQHAAWGNAYCFGCLWRRKHAH